MKAIVFFITAFVLLQSLPLFSQCISIELSVTWKMEVDIFNKDSMVNTPVLNITYRNNCEVNYYFFKVSPMKDEQSMVTCIALIQYMKPINYYERAKAMQGCGANQSLNVIIGLEPIRNMVWLLTTDTTEYYEDSPAMNVSCCLNSVYEYYYPAYYKKNENRNSDFVSADMISDSIMSGSVKDQFVFLKPNEKYVDSYNLIGYKIVEGCFTFSIYKDKIENYVLTSDYDSVNNIFSNPKLVLPPVVGEYKLYSGPFNTNKVTVCFGEK